MNIPNLPTEKKMIMEDGEINSVWYLFFSQLITAMQTNLSDEGIAAPLQSTLNIVRLNTEKSIGRLIYDQDLDVMKVNLAGIFKTITTS